MDGGQRNGGDLLYSGRPGQAELAGGGAGQPATDRDAPGRLAGRGPVESHPASKRGEG